MRELALELGRATLDLLLPPRCADCAAPIARDAVLCARCDRRLERLPPGVCALCQAAPAPAADDAGLCAACAAQRTPLGALVAALVYAGDVETWIQRFKYPRPGLRGLDPAPIAVVTRAAVEAAGRAPGPAPDRVVPVPLHASRLRARGFNPAGLLARAVARAVGSRCDPVALVRTRATRSQTGLDRAARLRNVRGAFRARRPLQGRIWLVDDVATTGATLSEAARALRRAGAREVLGICAARRP